MITTPSCAVLVALLSCPPGSQLLEGNEGDDLIRLQMQRSWAVVSSQGDRPPTGPAPGSSPSDIGAWEGMYDWDVVAIHAAVLPTGDVLHYAYPSGGSTGSQARVWSPTTGAFTEVNMTVDIFCSGLSHLPDGRLLQTGGNNDNCEFQGRRVVNIYDPFDQSWTSAGNMVEGRWYPANVTLPDGRTLIFSGLDLTCKLTDRAEMFTPATGNISTVANAQRFIDLYARLHVLSDGRIAHVGPEWQTWTYDLDDGWSYVTSNDFGWRSQNTSVLIPGRVDEIMIIGGGSPVTNTCEIIDFKSPRPEYRYTDPMTFPRAHLDALILPDKTVLVMGGGQDGLYGSPILAPELFDPETETWTVLPNLVHGRMYHATTLLLPDGRVLVAGQDSGPSYDTAEIYLPPYLFRGERPVIADAPEVIAYDTPFDISLEISATIDDVVLVKLSSVTHSVNFEQRLIDLEFTAPTGDTLVATAPEHANLAPPGYYMLFVLNPAGVPSVSRILRLGAGVPGDVTGDGTVTVDDLLVLLASWGPCPGDAACPADLDGDGVVGIDDLLAVLGGWT